MTPDITFRAMRGDDWPAVRDIYEAGIATGHATFETSAPTWQHWDHTHLAGHRLVAAIDGEVAGWAALSPVSDRCVYGGVAENSIYIHPDNRGRGVGRALLAELITSSETAGIWTVQTGIFPENTASLALHERVGFRIIGTRHASDNSTASGKTSCSSNAAAPSSGNGPWHVSFTRTGQLDGEADSAGGE